MSERYPLEVAPKSTTTGSPGRNAGRGGLVVGLAECVPAATDGVERPVLGAAPPHRPDVEHQANSSSVTVVFPTSASIGSTSPSAASAMAALSPSGSSSPAVLHLSETLDNPGGGDPLGLALEQLAH